MAHQRNTRSKKYNELAKQSGIGKFMGYAHRCHRTKKKKKCQDSFDKQRKLEKIKIEEEDKFIRENIK